jgi:hypothetical protein
MNSTPNQPIVATALVDRVATFEGTAPKKNTPGLSVCVPTSKWNTSVKDLKSAFDHTTDENHSLSPTFTAPNKSSLQDESLVDTTEYSQSTADEIASFDGSSVVHATVHKKKTSDDWKNPASFAMRPGVIRGKSMDPDEIAVQLRQTSTPSTSNVPPKEVVTSPSQRRSGRRKGTTEGNSDSAPTLPNRNHVNSLRPANVRGTSFDDMEELSTEHRPDFSMRPQAVRGQSFDGEYGDHLVACSLNDGSPLGSADRPEYGKRSQVFRGKSFDKDMVNPLRPDNLRGKSFLIT